MCLGPEHYSLEDISAIKITTTIFMSIYYITGIVCNRWFIDTTPDTPLPSYEIGIITPLCT